MIHTIIDLAVVFGGSLAGSVWASTLLQKRPLTCASTSTLPKRVEALTINLFGDPDWDIFFSLKKAIEKKPKVLRVEIVGLGRIYCDAILAIYHLLLNRGEVRLAVDLQTSLVGGALLLVLLADEVNIRPDTWFEIEKIEEDPDIVGVRDLETVDKLLNQFLPTKTMRGKRVPLKETLEEFSCLKNSDLDQKIEKLLVA